MILPLIELILDKNAERQPSNLNFDNRPQINGNLTNRNKNILVEPNWHPKNNVLICRETEKVGWFGCELILP